MQDQGYSDFIEWYPNRDGKFLLDETMFSVFRKPQYGLTQESVVQ